MPKQLLNRSLVYYVLASSFFVSSTSYAATQTVTNDAPLNNSGDDILFNSPWGKLTVADGQNLGTASSVSAVTDTAHKGTIEFQGGSTVNGTIGSSILPIQTIDILGASGKTVTLQDNIFVDTLAFTGDETVEVSDGKQVFGVITSSGKFANDAGTLTFLGNSTTVGDIGTNAFQLNNVNIRSKTLTIKNNIYAAVNTTIDTGAELLVNANNKTISDLKNDGTLTLGLNTLIVLNGFYLNANSLLNLTLRGGSSFISGNINNIWGVISGISANSTINVRFQGGSVPSSVVTIMKKSVNIVNTPMLTGSTQTYTLSLSLSNAGKNLDLNIIRTPFSQSVPNATYQGVSQMLDVLGQTVDVTAPTLLPLINALESLPTAQSLEEAMSTFVPAADTSLVAGSYVPISKGLNAISARLTDRRLGLAGPYASYVSGDAKAYEASWIQVFGGGINQKIRKGIAGYDAYFAGIAIGHEWDLGDDLVLGVSGTFTQTKVNSNNIGRNKLWIHSDQGTFYTNYNFCGLLYLDTLFSFAYHDYDSIRNIMIPTSAEWMNKRAEGDFHGWQFSIRPEVGHEWRQGNVFAIPNIWLQYSTLLISEHAETGAGEMNLYVDYNNIQELKLAVGLKFGMRHENEDCLFLPQIHGTIVHDFINDPQSSTSSFAGGGMPFTTSGVVPDKTSYLVGANIAWWFNRKQNRLNFQYDQEMKEDFRMHGGFLKATLTWL